MNDAVRKGLITYGMGMIAMCIILIAVLGTSNILWLGLYIAASIAIHFVVLRNRGPVAEQRRHHDPERRA